MVQAASGDRKVHVLVAEDDDESQELMRAIFRRLDWACTVASDGAAAWKTYQQSPADFGLVIVDALMPMMDGLELCRRIRSLSPATPVIISSALDTQLQVLQGIQSGADDYLAKPIDVNLLVAKMKRALDRSADQDHPHEELYECADLALDARARRVTKRGREIRLTKLEFGVLQFLITKKNHVRSAEDILRSVWGEEYSDDRAVLRAVIRRLRRKIQPNGGETQYIVTHIGAGYSCSEGEPEPSDNPRQGVRRQIDYPYQA